MGIADRDYMRIPRRNETPDEYNPDEPGGRPTGPFRILLVLIGLILLIAFLGIVFGIR
jgi:hypothetical protein